MRAARHLQGFSLIELMIAVAIVSVLASIALPAYQGYSVRAKISEVVLAMSACRTSISEIYQGGGSAPGPNNWGCEAGVQSKYVVGVATSADGMVTAQVQNISSDVDGRVLTLTPLSAAATPATTSGNFGTGLFGWRCGDAADGTNVALKYLPASCRSI
jgi:type IV pilus assembly protein PilA